MIKKNILIYWTSRTFIEVILPLLNDFTKIYNIYLILFDFSTPKAIAGISEKLLRDKTVLFFRVTPHHKKIAHNFIFMNNEQEFLKSIKFDCWLSDLEFLPNQRFIIVSAHKEEEHLLKLIN